MEGNVFRSVGVCVFTFLWMDTPQMETPSGWRPPLDGDPLWMETPMLLTSSGGHCSGGYTSYLNAFLCITDYDLRTYFLFQAIASVTVELGRGITQGLCVIGTLEGYGKRHFLGVIIRCNRKSW